MHCMAQKVSMKHYLYGKPAVHFLLHVAYSHNFAAHVNPYCDFNSCESLLSAKGGCFVTLNKWFFTLVANHLGNVENQLCTPHP